MEAVLHRNYVSYLKTLTVVNAIMVAANSIASSLGGGGSQDSGKKLNENLKSLQKLLLPTERDLDGERIERVKRTLQREASKGPIKVKTMAKTKKKKTRSFKV